MARRCSDIPIFHFRFLPHIKGEVRRGLIGSDNPPLPPPLIREGNSNSTIIRHYIHFAVALLLITILPAYAEWNQWRGENRDGIITGWKAPATLPEEIKQVWSAEIGIGHSSPVISGKSVFTISRIGEQEVVASRDLANGKVQWKDSYAASYTVNPAAFSHGPGPNLLH